MTLTATPQKPKSVSPTKSAKAVTQQELEEFVKDIENKIYTEIKKYY